MGWLAVILLLAMFSSTLCRMIWWCLEAIGVFIIFVLVLILW